jgi:hypothetical protein
LRSLYLILLSSCFVAIIIRHKKLPKPFELFIPLLTLSLAVELIRFFLDENNSISSFFFSIYTPFEYSILSSFYFCVIKNIKVRYSILISIPIFIAISVYIQFFIQTQNFFYKYLDVLVQSPLICLWSLCVLFQISVDESEMYIKGNPVFWMAFGNLIFFSGSLFSYGFGSYFLNLKHKDFSDAIFFFAKILNLILYVFYIISFTCSIRRK